jgi:GTP diphosphokinase / guanosine-3',5'-bis(diphosphate) 3'-diphosphatase
MTYEKLLQAIKQNQINLDEVHLRQVYQFAEKAHSGQNRLSGEPFITHPLSVAQILASWKQPQIVLEAALLHDIVEDTSITFPELEKKFGPEIVFLVDAISKVGQVKIKGKLRLTPVETLRKMFVAMAKDIRVIIIKLADRYHNLTTLSALPKDKQKRIAHNTLEIYAPLAERLGMGMIKGELEDLAFPYVKPKSYTWVTKLAKEHFSKAENVTDKTKQKLQEIFSTAELNVEVNGRPKHKYSLYKKLVRPSVNKDFSKIHDLIALRVITKNKTDCYTCLGLIHDYFKPVPHLGISDFIAQPKPNGYQSIHTKVFDRQGRIIEIQIRSQEMHFQSEYGAASHTLYSEAKNHPKLDEGKLEKGSAFKIDRHNSWLVELAQWQSQAQNSEEFVNGLTLDALSERIYIFTPLGDVIDLPIHSTPVDFAFAIHRDLGLSIQGAKVNQKIVTLNSELKSGDIVEILKSKTRRNPSREWLRFVKTTKAISEIKKALAKLDESR